MTDRTQEPAEPQRVESQCTRCGVTDSRPRHVWPTTGGGENRSLHFECCAAEGCEICPLQISAVAVPS